MPRKRTARIAEIKKTLVEKITEGHRRPGNWFISNRELAARYEISYQTAHRLISELCEEGYLHRTPASGTYVASEKHPPTGIALMMNENSQSEERRFGSILRRMLEERFEQEGIAYDVYFQDEFTGYPPERFCVIWGGRFDLHEISSEVHYSVLIDQKPSPGLNAIFTDSISVDLYSAGASAAQLLHKKGPFSSIAALLGTVDLSPDLLNGFQSITQTVAVAHATEWEVEACQQALQHLRDISRFDALFCGSNTAAEVAIEVLGKDFPMVAYGDEVRAVQSGTTALTIPWQEIVDEVIEIYHLRSMGNSSVAGQRILSPNLYLAPGWRR